MSLASKIEKFLHTEPVKVCCQTGKQTPSRKVIVNRTIQAILLTIAVLSVLFGYARYQTADVKTDVLTASLDNARIGVWTYDYTTQKVTWNTTMFDIFKVDVVKSGEVTYAFFNSFVAEEDKERVELEVNAAMRERRPFISYFQIVDGNGNKQLIRASGVMLDCNTMQGINILTGAYGYDEITREKLDEILTRLRQ